MSNLRKKTEVLLAVLSISIFALLTFSNLAPLNMPKHTHTQPHTQPLHIHFHKRIQIAHSTCQGTLYPDLCVSTLSTFPDLQSKPLPAIISALVNHTVSEVRDSASNCSGISRRLPKLSPLERRALEDCLQLFDYTVAELKSVISDLSPRKSSSKHYHDLQTLLSAAMTNQYTCLDGFAYSNGKVRRYIEDRLFNISHHVSNSLALLNKIPGVNASAAPPKPGSFPGYGSLKKGFPRWVSRTDRRLLQASANKTKFDLVVAKDGSGNFTTIQDAVDAAPNRSTTRFVIYIKAGAYYEYVEVQSWKRRLMFVGDGIGKTLVKGDRSVGGNWTTFRSATVAVVGDGFLAKGITFENYAGPSKHQAVALRSGSDFSAFYQCSFVGYQDTLYVHTLRQFYRECDIYGTIDFIFGNAAVVFQNCSLYARRPNPNQRNAVTAQGRQDPLQNTGISILNCKVAAAADLIPVQSSFQTYLGRPWKEYSRTVYMLSYMGDLINPAGWLEWDGDFALKTLYYREYMNRGPGSNTSARVTWPGYKATANTSEVIQFTVGNFIQGGNWLPATGIPFYLNLTP